MNGEEKQEEGQHYILGKTSHWLIFRDGESREDGVDGGIEGRVEDERLQAEGDRGVVAFFNSPCQSLLFQVKDGMARKLGFKLQQPWILCGFYFYMVVYCLTLFSCVYV